MVTNTEPTHVNNPKIELINPFQKLKITITAVHPPTRFGELKLSGNKVISFKDWDERTDRDLSVSGRHSRRYYEAAIRWMVGSVNLQKQWTRSPRKPFSIAKSTLNVLRGRVGMRLSRHEVERLSVAGTPNA